MCDICGMDPCYPQCPNYIGPERVAECVNCWRSIYKGEFMYNIDGSTWCEECIENCRQVAGGN